MPSSSAPSGQVSPLRDLSVMALRLSLRNAAVVLRRLLATLDEAGHGGGRAIVLVDEALELVVEAERSLWVCGPVRRSTPAVRLAVARARERAERAR